MRSARAMLPVVLVLAATAATGCGGPSTTTTVPKAVPTVTVWSGMPYRGPQRDQTLAYARAIRGAIWDLRGLARGYRVRYVALDDSSEAGNGWDPAVVAGNARRASLAGSTIAYLGDLDSGATAVALPILNQSGILQISATSTAEGLTRGGIGAGPGAPFQYYPSGRRTFARMAPHDSLQGAVVAGLAARRGCTSVAIIDDGTIYGAGLAQIIGEEAAARRVRVSFKGTLDPEAAGYARSVRAVRAGCIVYAGDPGDAAVKVVTDAARHNRRAPIFVTDALVAPSFADHAQGGIGPRLATRVTLVAASGGPDELTPFGRSLFDRLGGGVGHVVAPNVASVYAAAELTLRCIDAVHGRTGFRPGRMSESRRAMVSCVLARRHRSVALGDYRIHADGDWTRRHYSQMRIVRGRIVQVRGLRAPRPIAQPQPVVNPTG